MKQVYKIDSNGYYLEPVILYPRYEEQEVEVTPDPYTDEQNNVIRPKSYKDVQTVAVYDLPEDCVEEQPPSFYKARWQDGEWVEAGQVPEAQSKQPTVDEKVSALERENRMLRLQNETIANQYQFLEDVITEMIVSTLP